MSILTLVSLIIHQIWKLFLEKWSPKRALQSPTDKKDLRQLYIFSAICQSVKGKIFLWKRIVILHKGSLQPWSYGYKVGTCLYNCQKHQLICSIHNEGIEFSLLVRNFWATLYNGKSNEKLYDFRFFILLMTLQSN